jgi:hypothetical protein
MRKRGCKPQLLLLRCCPRRRLTRLPHFHPLVGGTFGHSQGVYLFAPPRQRTAPASRSEWLPLPNRTIGIPRDRERSMLRSKSYRMGQRLPAAMSPDSALRQRRKLDHRRGATLDATASSTRSILPFVLPRRQTSRERSSYGTGMDAMRVIGAGYLSAKVSPVSCYPANARANKGISPLLLGLLRSDPEDKASP